MILPLIVTSSLTEKCLSGEDRVPVRAQQSRVSGAGPAHLLRAAARCPPSRRVGSGQAAPRASGGCWGPCLYLILRSSWHACENESSCILPLCPARSDAPSKGSCSELLPPDVRARAVLCGVPLPGCGHVVMPLSLVAWLLSMETQVTSASASQLASAVLRPTV